MDRQVIRHPMVVACMEVVCMEVECMVVVVCMEVD
jgi:hypothetical protein